MEDKDIVNAVLELTKITQSNPNSAIQAAEMTVIGMILVSIITVLSQLIVTMFVLRAERKRVFIQSQLDKKNELDLKWHSEVKSEISNLIVQADQDNSASSQEKMLHAVYSLNLLLDRRIPEQESLNSSINELAASYDGWHKNDQRYKLIDVVIEKAKKIIYQTKI